MGFPAARWIIAVLVAIFVIEAPAYDRSSYSKLRDRKVFTKAERARRLAHEKRVRELRTKRDAQKKKDNPQFLRQEYRGGMAIKTIKSTRSDVAVKSPPPPNESDEFNEVFKRVPTSNDGSDVYDSIHFDDGSESDFSHDQGGGSVDDFDDQEFD